MDELDAPNEPNEKSDKESDNRYDPAHEPVEDEVLDLCVKNVQRIVNGNGFDPRKITRTDFEGSTYNFDAVQIFALSHKVTDKTVPGKHNADTIGAPEQVHQRAEEQIGRVVKNREIRKHMMNMLMKRPDLGFAVENLPLPLKNYDKQYVIHEPCNKCGTKGYVNCQHCHGKGEIVCPKCTGQGEIPCQKCRGTRVVQTPQGQQPCTFCRGEGRSMCVYCNRRGRAKCHICKGTRKQPCQPCNHSGWMSHVFTIALEAKSKFDYDRNPLPEEMPPLIDAYGAELVLEQHAQVRLDDSEKAAEKVEVSLEKNEFAVPYEVKLPFGDIELSFAGKPLKGKLFGYQGLLKFAPPYLEKIAGKGFASLQDAASGKGDALTAALAAAKYRIIRETIAFSAQMSPKKALEAIKERYKSGITEDTLKTLLQLSQKTIIVISQRPRKIGLAVGSIAAGAIIAGYHFYGRPFLAQTPLAAGSASLMTDFTVIGFAGAMILMIVKIFTAGGIKKSLPFLKETLGDKKLHASKSSGSGNSAFIAAIAAYAAVIAIGFAAGTASPPWFAIFGLG